MSARYRGTSPTNAKKIITPEAEEAQKKAQEAFMRRNAKKQDFFSQYGYHIVIGGFILLIVVAFANTFFSKSRNPDVTPVIDQDDIESHNRRGYSYTLGSNTQFDQWMLSDAKNSLNAQLSSRQNINPCASSENTDIIPNQYDFREQFPKCKRSEVYTQEKCASSYAISVASTISDRLCRQDPNNQYIDLSPQPLIDCDTGFTMGCKGGYVSRGFDYAKKTGLPSTIDMTYSGETVGNCENINTFEKYQIVDQCVAIEEEGIKREIIANGPVVVVIPVYVDFLVYKNGIYQILDGVSAFRSGQALKILGWGQDQNSRQYWIVENSWGATWGQNGYAHIYTKQDLLHLESAALAPVVTAKVEEVQQEQGQEQA